MFCHSGFKIQNNSYLLEHVLIVDKMLDDKFTFATREHTHLIFLRKQYMYLILWYASVSLQTPENRFLSAATDRAEVTKAGCRLQTRNILEMESTSPASTNFVTPLHINSTSAVPVQNMLFCTDYMVMRGVYRSSLQPSALLID